MNERPLYGPNNQPTMSDQRAAMLNDSQTIRALTLNFGQMLLAERTKANGTWWMGKEPEAVAAELGDTANLAAAMAMTLLHAAANAAASVSQPAKKEPAQEQSA